MFIYYLLEFADCTLFTEIVSQISEDTANSLHMPLLKVIIDVICVYQQNDPYTIQIALSILNLLCSNELQ